MTTELFEVGSRVEFRFTPFSRLQEGVIMLQWPSLDHRFYTIKPDRTRQTFLIDARFIEEEVDKEITKRHKGIDFEAEADKAAALRQQVEAITAR